jgi:hypothetical protein
MEKLYSNGSELIHGTHVTVRQVLIGASNLIEFNCERALCLAIQNSLGVYGINVGENDLSLYIDKFTRENAIDHASALSIGGFWWNYHDVESRLKFLDWLLTQYK